MKLTASLLICGLLGSSGAWAQTSKLSPDLAGIDPHANVKVIIQWKSLPQQPAQPSLLGLVGDLVGDLLGTVLGLINATVTTVTGSSLNNLAKDPNVVYITPDRPVRGKLDYTTAAVNASAAWSAGLTGAGVGVAVIDSGINKVPDLSLLAGLGTRVVYSQDFVGGNGQDAYGHGTHVAGIIASNGTSSSCLNCTRTFRGIAPGANVLDFRVLDENGQGSDSSVIAAIEQAIALKNTYNIRVINLSLGGPIIESYAQDPLCQGRGSRLEGRNCRGGCGG